jgi:tRNA threonylcarbamoyladenosine biosynthesis protein TsaE
LQASHDPCSVVSSLTRHLDNDTDTLALGRALAAGLEPGMVVYLQGELGAGKTSLARGILRGFGYLGKVKSPTYTLVELYDLSRLYLYHFDFYRLEDPHGWIDAGFREYFNEQAICLVEWPEKAGDTLPEPDIDVRIEIPAHGRTVQVIARSAAGQRCLSALEI